MPNNNNKEEPTRKAITTATPRPKITPTPYQT